MAVDDSDHLKAAALVSDGQEAERLLARCQNPAMVRAMAIRADELRFESATAALGVAEAALGGLSRLPAALQRPGIASFVWATYGSILRARARFDEAEVALAIASRLVPRSRREARADLERRFAYLRADQGHRPETQRLVASFVGFARRTGGARLGQELVNAGAILMLVRDYQAAADYLEEALTLLPPNGDRRHISAVYNLASCCLELSSSRAELFYAAGLSRQAAALIETGSDSELRLRWLQGKLQRRLGSLDESLELLESARQGVDQRCDGYDRALLVLDIAELHLDRRDYERANELARSSFGILSALRDDREAFRAVQVFYRAGVALALDRATVVKVRHLLLELKRQPRPPEP